MAILAFTIVIFFILGLSQTSYIVLASSADNGKSGIVTLAELKVAIQDPSVLIIDVRQPIELIETGVIPNSINIPLDKLENTLKNQTPQSFLQQYKRQKPPFDTTIIFTCRSGKRSGQAQKIALNLGFVNTKNYGGGWLEWEANLNKTDEARGS
ncbi:putative heat shock protein [Trypoxylus dichotomus]